MNNKIIKITVYFGLFLLLTGVSYFAFDSLIPAEKDSSIASPSGKGKKNNTAIVEKDTSQFSGPKTEACPINGALFTKEEKEIWSQRRPLVVMIENHQDSRPQSGLSNADIVYEAVAEGGITRFMGVFYCGAVKGAENKYDLGPVRSARTYFLDLASEYADYPLYNHVGGANCSAPKDPATGKSGACTTNKKAQAIEQIADYGWNNQGTWGDMSEFSLSYKVCRREAERTGDVRATEHTMYCSSKELWKTAQDRGLTNLTIAKNNSPWDKNYRPWLFKQKDQASSSPNATNITFDFWSGYKDYSVNWKYDSNSNSYLRTNGGKPHIDFNTKQQLSTKNIVIEFTKESRSIDEHLHNLYEVVGSGSGVLIQNGQKIDITWSKATRTSRTIYKDASGKEVNFIPGQVWVEILPVGTKVTYEGAVQS